MLTTNHFVNAESRQIVAASDIISRGIYNSKHFVSTKHDRVIFKPRICSYVFRVNRNNIKPEMLGKKTDTIKLTVGTKHHVPDEFTVAGIKAQVTVKANSVIEVIRAPNDSVFIEIAVFEDQ